MGDIVPIIILAMAVGLCVLAGTLLGLRVKESEVYLPLAIFFLLFAFLNLTTVMNHVAPHYDIILSTLSITVVSLLLWPMLWFYIEGLTHETRWHFDRRHVKHLIPILLGLMTVLTMALLPEETRASFFSDTASFTETPLSMTASVLLLLVVTVWILQTAVYFILGLRRLVKYRRRLKDIFASTESRELTWLLVLFLCLGATGVFAFLDYFLSSSDAADDGIISATWEELVLTGFLFTLAVWGLRQTPGFEEIYDDDDDHDGGGNKAVPLMDPERSERPGEADNAPITKYRNSGLDDIRATRIAGKLDTLMQSEELYLDPNLSLPVLAKRLGVSTNILSQTLNETIKASFFDYVNKHRIAASLPMMVNRDKPILTVAMAVGFNSRSAFYKAFKRETGTTPGSYLNKA